MSAVFNVVIPVIANVAEETGPDAYHRLANAIRAAGFEVFEENGLPLHKSQPLLPPFEAEPGTVADL